MASCTSCLLSRSSDQCSQHFCDVCKYIFRMDWSNGHNNQCSNHVFKVYAFCHYCSTVHEVPHRLGSTMMCLYNFSLSNTIHHSPAHHHPTAVSNKSTFYHGIDEMHENNDSPTSNDVDNDSNCLCDSSDSNESSSFLNCSWTYGCSVHWRRPLNNHVHYYLWERRWTHCCHLYHANNSCHCQQCCLLDYHHYHVYKCHLGKWCSHCLLP